VASPRQRLSRDAILDAALGIIDEGGLESCTMRAVAAELGVEAMSLYWHVPGKEALLDGVVERMLSAAPVLVHQDDWRDELYGIAQGMRGVLLMHPNAIPLLAGRALGSYTSAGAVVATTLATLEAAGFDRLVAIRAARTIYRYVIGYALVEGSVRSTPDGQAPPSNPDESSILAEFSDALANDPSSDLFEYGLHTLLDGMAVSLRPPAPG
jgi:TetR/AcrR family tetracycline transcriptional repressor